jgi:hypothetical protein
MTPAVLARLTDSRPPTEVAAPPPLRRVCAWCVDFDPRAPGNKGATHTICPDCQSRLWAA